MTYYKAFSSKTCSCSAFSRAPDEDLVLTPFPRLPPACTKSLRIRGLCCGLATPSCVLLRPRWRSTLWGGLTKSAVVLCSPCGSSDGSICLWMEAVSSCFPRLERRKGVLDPVLFALLAFLGAMVYFAGLMMVFLM